PSTLAYGNQAVGSTSSSKAVTLSNSGNATLNISSIAITGANAADFAETDTCGSTLAANSSCTINVTFTPGASGSRAATLAVADNAAGSPQSVSLSGTGTSASVTLTPSSLTFSSRSVGSASTAQTVTLKNTGNSTLTL